MDRRQSTAGEPSDAQPPLPGRREFQEGSKSGDEDATHIAYIDLDDFGSINRELGVVAGDTALDVICRRCRSVNAEAGVVYRLGGNEFALVATGPSARASQTLRQLLELIRLPITAINERRVTATAGVVEILPGEDWLSACERANRRYIDERRAGGDRFNAF
jgi:diguanylate cyclase (GGDEF)-like protein